MYEIERREFRSRIYAAISLLSANKKVVLFQHNQIYRIAIFSKPGHIFLKSSPYQFDPALKLLKMRGFKIHQWQEEGIHFGFTIRNPLTLSKTSISLTDNYLAWHDVERDVVTGLGMNSNKITVTGNMRLEYLKALRNLRYPSHEQIKILVLTNFDYSLVKYPLTRNAAKSIIEAEADNQELLSREMKSAQLNHSLYQDFVSKALSMNFLITVRPYFYEDPNNLDLGKNVKIDKNTSIYDSFLDHDFLVHYGSTAGLEAIIAGLPSIILTADPNLLNPAIFKISEVHLSVKDLIETITVYGRNKSLISKLVGEQLDKIELFYGSALLNSKHISTIDFLTRDFEKSEQLRNHLYLISRIRLFLDSEIFQKFKYLFRKNNRHNRFLKANRLRCDFINEEVEKILKIVPTKRILFEISRNKKQVMFYLQN